MLFPIKGCNTITRHHHTKYLDCIKAGYCLVNFVRVPRKTLFVLMLSISRCSMRTIFFIFYSQRSHWLRLGNQCLRWSKYNTRKDVVTFRVILYTNDKWIKTNNYRVQIFPYFERRWTKLRKCHLFISINTRLRNFNV